MAIAISEKKTSTPMGGRVAPLANRPKAAMGRLLGQKVPPREVLFFTNQLSLMLEIGTPLNQSLSAIAGQTRHPGFKAVLEQLIESVEDGSMLSDALRHYPELFSAEYISLVSAGENTGHLYEMLDRIVELQEKREEFISALKGAMTYPLVLCAVTTLVIIFMLSFVFPRFAALFQGVEQILPPTTKFLMALSGLLRAYWYLLPLLFGVLWWGVHRFLRTDRGRFTVDRLKISLPLLAEISIKIYLSQIMRTLGFLMGSSVPLLEALRITRGGSRNVLFTRFLDRIIENVESGRGLSPAFGETPFIPETVVQMVSTGEASQKLDRVLLRLSEHYETEIKAQIKRLTTIVEPALLVLMGIVVGLIVVSLILPIFKLSKVVH